MTSGARRTLLKAGGTLLLSVVAPLPASAAQILAVRVWPADDYTRVTLENDSNLKTEHFLVPDPPRLVVDVMRWMPKPSVRTILGLAVAAVAVSLYLRRKEQGVGSLAAAAAEQARPSSPGRCWAA